VRVPSLVKLTSIQNLEPSFVLVSLSLPLTAAGVNQTFVLSICKAQLVSCHTSGGDADSLSTGTQNSDAHGTPHLHRRL